MSTITYCLDGIIGVTPKACDCLGTEATESSSGLYLDGLVEMSDIFGLIDCQNGDDVSEIALRSLDDANIEFLADFNSTILNDFTVKRKHFNGAIGKPTYKTALNIADGRYAGLRIFCADIVSGYMKINKIGTLFGQSGNVDLTIVNNLGEIVDTVTVAAIANQHTLTTVNLTLPLHNEYAENLEYFIYYTKVAGMIPKDNQVKCSTCGSFRAIYNTMNPYFNSQTGGQMGWAEWVMVGGLNVASDVDWTDINTTTNNYMNGLTLSVEFGCVSNDIVCQNVISFDDNPLAMAIAHAIRYKAASMVINKLLRADIINRPTMINREEKAAVILYYNERYSTMIQYIIENLEFKFNDCYMCKDKWGMRLGGIRN